MTLTLGYNSLCAQTPTWHKLDFTGPSLKVHFLLSNTSVILMTKYGNNATLSFFVLAPVYLPDSVFPVDVNTLNGNGSMSKGAHITGGTCHTVSEALCGRIHIHGTLALTIINILPILDTELQHKENWWGTVHWCHTLPISQFLTAHSLHAPQKQEENTNSTM